MAARRLLADILLGGQQSFSELVNIWIIYRLDVATLENGSDENPIYIKL